MKKPKWKSIRRTKHFDPDAGGKPAKVRVTTFIDSDVLNSLKAAAAKNGGEMKIKLIDDDTKYFGTLRSNRTFQQKIEDTDLVSLHRRQETLFSMLEETQRCIDRQYVKMELLLQYLGLEYFENSDFKREIRKIKSKRRMQK